MYIIRDREAGNVIDKFNTIEEAKAEVLRYEEEDKREDTYEEDFYEIVEMNRQQAQNEWDRLYTKQYKFKFNKNTDKDIIEYLESLDNKQGKIKELIRKEIENQK